jgi:hypothetical protein
MLAEKASQRLIAAALGRSVPNLRKFFAAELELEIKSAAKIAPFRITPQMRDDVALLAACREPSARIAKAIGVSCEDLEAYFSEELGAGAARYRLKTLRLLTKMAERGVVGAANRLANLTEALGDATEPGATSGYVGKKAAAKADADAAVSDGGRFAPRATPRLAAVNGKPVGAGD